MQNKLQELTDKLYNEGLSKGKQEAEQLRSNAKKEAEKIIADAKNEAANIIAMAQKEAEQIKSRVENDLKMASAQTVSALKQQVENIILTKALSSPVKSSLTDAEFLKSVIMTIAQAFNASNAESSDLNVILPAAMQEQLQGAFLQNETSRALQEGINVTFSKQIAGGFKIGPKNGGYLISFSDNDFERLIAEYLRPATKKLLFG